MTSRPGLRQEIVDELADHLACSYNRELLRGTNPDEAQTRVIERFGDPAAVACRLWLDAMRGKIMARRVVLATCLVVTLASLSVAGAMWRQSAQAQRESACAVAEAIRLMTDQNEKAQASQQALLKQLHEMSETIQSTKSLDWNPVTFKVTEETAEGTPVAGVSISLNERHVGAGGGGGLGSGNELATRVTDRSGIADFGVLHPGDYGFQVIRTWDQGSVITSGQFKIEPGSRIDRRVVCPRVPPDRVPVRVRTDWPDDLTREKLSLYAAFAINPIERGDLSWTLSDVRPSDNSAGQNLRRMAIIAQQPATRYVLCGPGTAMASVRPSRDAAYIWTPSGLPGAGPLGGVLEQGPARDQGTPGSDRMGARELLAVRSARPPPESPRRGQGRQEAFRGCACEPARRWHGHGEALVGLDSAPQRRGFRGSSYQGGAFPEGRRG